MSERRLRGVLDTIDQSDIQPQVDICRIKRFLLSINGDSNESDCVEREHDTRPTEPQPAQQKDNHVDECTCSVAQAVILRE